jgi:hypothetical protein
MAAVHPATGSGGRREAWINENGVWRRAQDMFWGWHTGGVTTPRECLSGHFNENGVNRIFFENQFLRSDFQRIEITYRLNVDTTNTRAGSVTLNGNTITIAIQAPNSTAVGNTIQLSHHREFVLNNGTRMNLSMVPADDSISNQSRAIRRRIRRILDLDWRREPTNSGINMGITSGAHWRLNHATGNNTWWFMTPGGGNGIVNGNISNNARAVTMTEYLTPFSDAPIPNTVTNVASNPGIGLNVAEVTGQGGVLFAYWNIMEFRIDNIVIPHTVTLDMTGW